MSYLLYGFQCHNKGYLYDGNSCCILSVDPEIANNAAGLCDEDADIVVEHLQGKGLSKDKAIFLQGFFQENIVPLIEQQCPSQDINEYTECMHCKKTTAIQPKHITFGITEACNFRCRYCVYSDRYTHTRLHSERRMSFDIMKKVVDKLATSLESKYTIGFYGGEPLIEFKLIEKLVTYAKSKLPSVGFAMTTNGYLLTPEVCDFLSKEKFHLTISIDVNKEIHDKYRRTVDGRPTYDVIMNNIQYLEDNYAFYSQDYILFESTIFDPNDLVAAEAAAKTDRRFGYVNMVNPVFKEGIVDKFEISK